MLANNIYQLNVDGKEILLIGTAHVSKQSAEQVKEMIEQERPDSVCIELDEGRYKSITEQNKWENTDIVQVIKEKRAILLLVNLILSTYQKRMANQFDIQPGQEMIQGIESAKKAGANIVLVDRDIQTTFKRIWRGVSFWGKVKLFFSIILSIFDDEEITEEELEKMKTEDMLTSALNELSSNFPDLKKYLVDERDQHLAQKIKEAPGKKIIAVLGAAHIPGIKEEIFKEHDLKKLTEIPRKPKFSKLIGWMIPLAIILMILSTFSVDTSKGIDQIISWILWNGSLSAIGTIIAGGHILSILTAFLVAPITSLNPLLAAGWFAGFTESFIRKPRVKDFKNLTEDISTIKGFWKNRVTKILLVVILANLGSVIGTWIGGINIIRSFIQNVL
ncbi:TraB/GumN family protein [Garciella nitratireducens]|uniref:Pheromone shutdown-related protein TraB n=1 Tax=Garciella nitratireducens DSM 15102 TaxID=1121911 RepID=A0A1T4KRF4_9FIRM|nr:TraB/GumN family protein [Garciella nitratireducens]SJZ45011.1 pheromone shutdown-related protein TraB [Garciella nitratireducens DSM 15102]